ncbi:hypothetical protein EXIGLDRAFT_773672 [Exidia glandulosa HHB12029]|uniref:Uncharacterized protein n=1 Tax=Exidia glandulosa HHB12029 TaxID=1314781 RepID=A0A165EPI2_EXIGL|nr:hypothetical protein EXIGLDRAFT_773672 [Exidia glandulosa HHB12029]
MTTPTIQRRRTNARSSNNNTASPGASSATPATQPLTPSSHPPSSSPSATPATAAAATQNNDDVTALAGTKRPRISDTGDVSEGMHPLTALGRHLGRIGNLFVPVKHMLRLGLYHQKHSAEAQAANDVADDDEEAGYAVVDIRCINAYDAALEIEPDLEALIRENGIKHFVNMVTTARRNARGEDIKKIRDIVATPRFRPWAPAITNYEDPRQRGWFHPQMGDLLCPKALDYGLAQTRHDLQHRILKPSPLLYPAFMYKDGVIHPNNKFRGFLKALDLIKSGRIIFNGPRAMDGGPASNRSVSKSYNMTEMTMPAIAYTTTIYAYGISSDERFDPEGKSGFQYRAFYNGLLDHLDSLTAKQRSIILTFWNNNIFPADSNPASSLPAGVMASAEEMAEQGDRDDDDDGDEWDAVSDNDDA